MYFGTQAKFEHSVSPGAGTLEHGNGIQRSWHTRMSPSYISPAVLIKILFCISTCIDDKMGALTIKTDILITAYHPADQKT